MGARARGDAAEARSRAEGRSRGCSRAMKAGTQREEEILSAAARIFREKGYHGTSVRDIAESVGLLKGSLYHYIRSKEELLARLFEGALEETVRELEEIAAREAPASERLRAMVRAYSL